MNALIMVDIQNDFVPGGALAVPAGHEIVPLANAVQPVFDLVVATKDWHPRDHGSFASNHPGRKPGDIIELNGLEQVLWPAHCVQGTSGAEFVPGLDTQYVRKTIYKGTDPAIDSYSTFFDNGHLKETGLSGFLHENSVQSVYLLGLATDYCVKFSALDAAELGFHTIVVIDGCRGIELCSGDIDQAINEMKASGIEILKSGALRK